jgi:hypothetical protein
VFVIFEETGERREVRRACRLCFPRGVTDVRDVSLVSPAGCAHEGADYGCTQCGTDATGDGWWWRQ